ncbi:MAG: hpaH [Ilumatobacteraceae bacterium]|nr:hpaH [Ilumatobacteraceae bacterium]
MNVISHALTADQHHAVAARHEAARLQVRPIKRTTLDHPDMTIDDAYACQLQWVQLQVANGARIVGHKIGLTSKAMQTAMKIDEPDFGTLLDHMIHPTGVVLRAADYVDPRLEVELAFVLGAPLSGTDVTRDDVLAATEWVAPALELIDARSHRTDPDDGVSRGVLDTIADNAADAGVVMGDVRVAPGDVDLRWVAAILQQNGVVEETGVAAGVLNDPVEGIVWLTHRLARYGVALEPGEIVLSGSFTRPVLCRAGDVIDVDYHDLGTITCTFT